MNKGKGKVARTWYRVVVTAVLLFGAAFAHAGIPEAQAWLASQQQADGSLVNTPASLATPLQSTSEYLRTLHVLGRQGTPEYSAALSYINSTTDTNTEALSRKIIANAEAGNDVAVLIDQLIIHQNEDGGFGDQNGYGNSVLDTAWAVEALGVSNTGQIDAVSSALLYLRRQQGADGGYGVDVYSPSTTYISALVASAMNRYRFNYPLAIELTALKEYLLSSQLLSGWGSDFETAHGLLAIMQLSSDVSRFIDSVTVLQASQWASGSWSDDSYSTALAARVSYLYSNLQPVSDPNKAFINGRLVEDTNGQGLVGASVSILELPGTVFTTLSDGSFSVTDLDAGTYTLQYRHPAYYTTTQSITLDAGSVLDVGTVRLTPLPDVGVISGMITDSDTGLPVSGAQVSVTGAVNVSVLSDNGGAYSITSPPGAVSITVSHGDYHTVSGSSTVVAGGTLAFSPALTPVSAPPPVPTTTVTIKGSVVDIVTNLPLAGVNISVAGTTQSVITGADGDFLLENVVAGDLAIDITSTDYQTVRFTATAPEGSIVNLGTVRLTAVTPPPSASSTLKGRVLDIVTQGAVSGASVEVIWGGIVPGSLITTTSADGSYLVEGIPETVFSITIQAPGYLDFAREVTLTQAAIVRMDVPMQRVTVSDIEITSLTAPADAYPALKEIYFAARLENTGTVTRKVRMYIQVRDSAGSVVDEYAAVTVPLGVDPSIALITVAPGTPADTEFTWHTARYQPGTYTIVAQAIDDVTGQFLTERGMNITVFPTNRIGGSVTFDPPIAQASARRPIQLTANVSNRGNLPVEAGSLTATVLFKNKGFGYPLNSFEIEEIAEASSAYSMRGGDNDTTGNFYVANYSTNEVWKFTPDGTQSVFATGLARPMDVDVNTQGNVYVLNRQNSFIWFTPDGVGTLVNTGLSNQEAIEAHADGRVLIVRGKKLHEVLPDGTVNLLASGGLANPVGLAENSKGEIFIANNGENSISMFVNGTLSTYVTGINRPTGITIDNTDNLYVTSFGDNALYKIAPDKTITTVATGLSGPYDVKMEPGGDFVVSNYNGHDVVSVTPDGQVSTYVAPSFAGPAAATYDGSGNLYVANSRTHDITRFATDGSTTKTVTFPYNPTDLKVDSGGNYHMLINNSFLYRIAPDGTQNRITNALNNAHAMVLASDGNGYLVSEVDTNRISRVDAAGQITPWATPYLSTARNLRRDSQGNIYVLNDGGFVTKISPTGQVSKFVTGLSYPRGLAVDDQDNLYITEQLSKKLYRVDSSGVRILIGTMTFTPGAVAVLPTGELLVGEYWGRRLFTVDSAGVPTLFATLANSIDRYLEVNASGTVWISHQGRQRVTRIDTDGTQTVVGVNRSPTALKEDGAGGVFISVEDGVKHLDSANTLTTNIAEASMSGVTNYGLTRDLVGRFWITDRNGILWRFSASGVLDKRFATFGKPRGLAYVGTDLIVSADNGNVVRITAPDQLTELLTKGNYKRITATGSQGLLMSSTAGVTHLNLQSSEKTVLATGFSSAAALTASVDGSFVVGDINRNTLTFFNANGTKQNVIAGLQNPRALLFDSIGNMLIGSTYPNSILTVRADGKLTVFSQNVGFVRGMMLMDDGRVYATDNSYIYEISLDGSIINKTLQYSKPTGIIRTVNNDILVSFSDDNKIARFNQDNSITKLAGGFSFARDVETDAVGDIYVADSIAEMVNIVNADGTLTLKGGGLKDLARIAVLPDGTVYALDSGRFIRSLEVDGTRKVFDVGKFMARRNIVSISAGLNDLPMLGTRSNYTTNNTYQVLRFIPSSSSILGLSPGEVVYTASATIPSLDPSDASVSIDLGSWIPAESGDYLVEVRPEGGVTNGVMTNTLHVGPNAYANLALSATNTAPGDQSVASTLNIIGADSTSITRVVPEGLTIVARGEFPARLGTDPFGNVYASQYTYIEKIAPDGARSEIARNLVNGQILAIDSLGNVYGKYGSKVRKFAPDGSMTELATLGASVAALAVDYQDRLYAVDFTNSLSRIHPDGRIELITRNGIITPYNGNVPFTLSIDGQGNFYVHNENNEIVRITRDGKAAPHITGGRFEYEGGVVTADCANNVLFAPILYPDVFPDLTGEERHILQRTGDTGETGLVLYGPEYDPDLDDMDELFYDRFAQRLIIYADNNGSVFGHGGNKLYSFPIICGGISVEAHVISRADVALASMDPAPTSTMDRGDGTKEYIWDLAEVDNKGFNINMNLLFQGMMEGEDRPMAQEAFLLFNNSFDPAEPVRVPIDIPTLSVTNRMSLATSLDAASYGPNATVQLTAEVSNLSNGEFNGLLEFSVLDTGNNVVTELPPVNVLGMPVGSTQTMSTNWDTGTTLAGSYKLVTRLVNNGSAVLASSEDGFSITAGTTDPAAGLASLRTTTDRVSYHTTDAIQVTNLVGNTSVNALLTGATLEVVLSNSAAQTLASVAMPISELTPGASRDLATVLMLTNAAEGAYLITGQVLATDGSVLATDTATLTVQSDMAKALAGAVELTATSLYRGEPQTCTATLINKGSIDVTSLETHHALVAVTGNGLISEAVLNITLAPNQSNVSIRTLETGALAEGDYACILQANVNGALETLAYAAFTVKQPPIQLDLGLAEGTRGRLLVMLDGPEKVCGGITQLDLSRTFVSPLPADTTLDVVVKSAPGNTLDRETATLAGFTGAVNTQPGGGGADLTLRAFDTNTLRLSLTPDAASTQLEDDVTVTATLQQAGATLMTLTSGALDTECEHPLAIDAVLGGFTLTDLATLPVPEEEYRDPDGPVSAPNTDVQQAFLKTLLAAHGWSATLVTDDHAFERAFRSGGYAAYAWLAEEEALDDDLGKELREAVYRGAGLILAPQQDHDDDDHGDDLVPALGVMGLGQATGIATVTIPPGNLLPNGGPLSLMADDTVHGLRPLTAETWGVYDVPPETILCDSASSDSSDHDSSSSSSSSEKSDDSEHDNEHNDCLPGDTAIAANSYGRGRTITAGFDWLAQATLNGAASHSALSLMNALAYVHPDGLEQNPHSVFPLTATVTNLGQPTLSRVILPLPSGTTVIDAGTGLKEGNQLHWTVPLAITERQTLPLWLQLPSLPGPVSLTAEAWAPWNAPSNALRATATLPLEVFPAQEPVPIQSALNALILAVPDTEALTQAQEKLDKAMAYWPAKPEKALKYALKAADKLITATVATDHTASLTMIRLMLADWIGSIGQRVPLEEQEEEPAS